MPRLTKKINRSPRRSPQSPYVIRLRATAPEEPKRDDRPMQSTIRTDAWSNPVQSTSGTPPRVDFVHNTVAEKSAHRTVHTAHTWNRSTVQRSIGAFVLVAFFLIIPFGFLEAFDRMSATTNILARGVGPLAARIELLAGHLGSGAWDAAARDARDLTMQFSTFKQSLDALPAVVRGALTIVPGYYDGAELIHHGGEASRLLESLMTDIARGDPHDPLSTMHSHRETVVALRDHAQQIDAHLRSLAKNSLFPERVTLLLSDAEARLAATLASANQFAHVVELIDRSAGFDQPRRYLVVFQNPHEIRATGGFLGSYAILNVRNGRVESFVIPSEGSYGLKGSMTQFVESPEPMRLINPQWQFQDANWWPDWPTTAKKILWFWDTAQQPTVDGVIAVNGTVFQDVLRIFGPLATKDRRIILSADTALETIETIINDERESDNRRQPKKILGDIASALQERVARVTRDEQRDVAAALWSALARREILVMSRVPEVQAHVKALGWDGSTSRDAKDYLMVVHSNIGGRKTDATMENATGYSVFIQPDGAAIATVTIERTHHGKRGSPLTGAPNKDYIRFYVPEGSQLIDAWGFTIPTRDQFAVPLYALGSDEDMQRVERDRRRDARTGTDVYFENGKTVFGQWLWTDIGARSSAGIRYVLPFRVRPPERTSGMIGALIRSVRDNPRYVPYDGAIVRQPGLLGNFTFSITTPPAWESVWRYPMTMTSSPATVQWSGDFSDDLWFGAVWKQ